MLLNVWREHIFEKSVVAAAVRKGEYKGVGPFCFGHVYMDQGRRRYHDLVMMQLYWGMTLIMAPAQAPKSITPLTAEPCRGAFQCLRLMPPTPRELDLRFEF